MFKYVVLLVISAYVCAAWDERNYNQKQCICTNEYDPYCGSNGVTYGNQCELRCEQRRNRELTAKKGVCKWDQEDCKCENNYKPVCGNDGKTYKNKCNLDCESKKNSNLKLRSQGECRKERICACPFIYKPVCGEDSKTYENDCTANCAGTNVRHQGKCRDCACPKNYEPICGSDGKTYNNYCEMRCEEMKNDKVKMSYIGRCNEEKYQNGVYGKPNCLCTREYRAVCGNDGKTYANECLMKCNGANMKKDGPCE